MNNNLLPSDEFIEYEGQFYTNPQKGLDEQNSFIDNLRNIQNANNSEISAQTYNLGTAVPSNLGGLVGGSGYWTSRLQTPQTNSLVANLKATAMAQALNEAMGNEVAMWKQRYNRAYSDYKRRNRNNNGGGGGGTTGGNNGNTSGWDGEVETISTDTTTNTDNNNTNTEANAAPPNPNDFYITGEEQTQKIQERSGMPEWLVNVLKIFG